MQVSKDNVVEIHYTLKDVDGNVIDSSEGREPLPFLCGANNIIKGLEEALLGKVEGDQVDVTVKPEDGYGTYQEQAIQEAPIEAFKDIPNLAIGMQLQAETPQGPIPVLVTAINDNTVTVDGNHPLAGKTLFFDVNINSVREATKEELDHGHPHMDNQPH